MRALNRPAPAGRQCSRRALSYCPQQHSSRPCTAVSAATTDKQLSVAGAVAEPLTCISALAGFALIASNIPVLSTDDPLQAAAPENLSSQSALQQLLASSGGAAQAASLEEAPDQLQHVLTSPLLQLDQAVHELVASHTTQAFRLMADIYISDAFITAGLLGWLACTAACLSKAPSKSAAPLAAAWGFYGATCGAVGHGDPLLVDALKHLFARARPSTLHHTFSFPSGHTAAAVFMVGAFLTVLLPLTLRLWPGQSSPAQGDTGSSDTTSSSTIGSSTQSSLGLGAADTAIIAVWGCAWFTTAVGRILSESHWLSDTLAGGCLAIASVSGLAWCSRLLEGPDSDSTRSSDAAAAAAAAAGQAPPQGDS